MDKRNCRSGKQCAKVVVHQTHFIFVPAALLRRKLGVHQLFETAGVLAA